MKSAVLYQSFFSETGLENSREIPAKSAVFPRICPWKSREIWLFFPRPTRSPVHIAYVYKPKAKGLGYFFRGKIKKIDFTHGWLEVGSWLEVDLCLRLACVTLQLSLKANVNILVLYNLWIYTNWRHHATYQQIIVYRGPLHWHGPWH